MAKSNKLLGSPMRIKLSSTSTVVFSTLIFLLFLSSTTLAFLDRSGNGTESNNNSSSEYLDGAGNNLELEDGEVEDVTEQIKLPYNLDDIEIDDTLKNTSTNCPCGVSNPSEEIGNGINLSSARARGFAVKGEPYVVFLPGDNAEAGEREYPWMAALTRIKYGNKRHVVCGGSLINSRYIVTAAHCINIQLIKKLEVNFNVHNVSELNPKKNPIIETRKIRTFTIHPGWNQETVDNDIGLLELDAPIDFAKTSIRPICLPSNHSNTDFDGLNATVAGWGYITPHGPNSKVLNKIQIPIYSERECIDNTIYKDKILPSMICAGLEDGGRDACTNDSGGPLMVEENGKHILVGIVSWGHGCAKKKAPGVYTRVTRYVDWITKEISRGEWCSS